MSEEAAQYGAPAPLEAIRENTSSIELTRSPKGEYSFKIKVYYDPTLPEDATAGFGWLDALGQIAAIDDHLRTGYLGLAKARP